MLLVCHVLLYVVALYVKMRYNDYWLIDWLIDWLSPSARNRACLYVPVLSVLDYFHFIRVEQNVLRIFDGAL